MKLIERIHEDNPPKGTVYLWFLGGSSFAIKFNDRNLIFTDLDAYTHLEKSGDIPAEGLAPALYIRRTSFLPFEPKEITKRSAYLSTHEHADHCDKGAVLAVVESGGVLVGPRSSCDLATSWGISERQIVRLDGEKFQKTEFDGVEIISAPGRDINAKTSNIYVVSCDGISILHNGDSLYDGPNYLKIADHFRKKIDVALINLGKNSMGRHWYHTPYDVARAANDLEPRFLICHHYDKWDILREDPENVATAIKASYPEILEKTKFVVLKNGERFDVSRQSASTPA